MGVGWHQLSVMTQTCIVIAVPRTKSSRFRLKYMKGFKVVQCITLIVSIYALFMAAVCPKDQKKLSLIMRKLV